MNSGGRLDLGGALATAVAFGPVRNGDLALPSVPHDRGSIPRPTARHYNLRDEALHFETVEGPRRSRG